MGCTADVRIFVRPTRSRGSRRGAWLRRPHLPGPLDDRPVRGPPEFERQCHPPVHQPLFGLYGHRGYGNLTTGDIEVLAHDVFLDAGADDRLALACASVMRIGHEVGNALVGLALAAAALAEQADIARSHQGRASVHGEEHDGASCPMDERSARGTRLPSSSRCSASLHHPNSRSWYSPLYGRTLRPACPPTGTAPTSRWTSCSTTSLGSLITAAWSLQRRATPRSLLPRPGPITAAPHPDLSRRQPRQCLRQRLVDDRPRKVAGLRLEEAGAIELRLERVAPSLGEHADLEEGGSH